MRRTTFFFGIILFLTFVWGNYFHQGEFLIGNNPLMGDQLKKQNLFIIGGFRERELFSDVYSVPVTELTGEIKLNWAVLGKIPKELQGHTSVALKDHIFVIGGLEGFHDNGPLYSSKVFSAEVIEGEIKNWSVACTLPHPLGYHSSVKFGNRIITSGGQAPYNVSSVYAVAVGEGGKMMGWKVIGQLPKPMRGHASIMVKNHLFILGGHDDREFFHQVYSAVIEMDGQILGWEDTTPLPSALVHFGIAEYKDRIYVFGGQDAGDKLHTEVYSAEAKEATLGKWRRETPFPFPQSRLTVNIIDEMVVATGGGFGWEPPVYSAVLITTIGENGKLKEWKKIGDLPQPTTFHSAVVYPD